jgi:hypothetical protein
MAAAARTGRPRAAPRPAPAERDPDRRRSRGHRLGERRGGPGRARPALAFAIFVSARATAPIERGHIDAFTRSFGRHFDPAELRAALLRAIEIRTADPNVSDSERADLVGLDWPIR